MRVVPRTVLGTWLLAGTAWLAGCAAIWWLLPDLVAGPPLSDQMAPGVQFSADSRWLAYADTGPEGAFIRVWDVPANRQVGRVMAYGPPAISPDGRTVATGECIGRRTRVRGFDLHT